MDRAKKQGIEQDEYNKSLTIASELKKEGLSIEFIAKTTKLSKEEIERLS
ncbi:hypothetical protein [Mucilaginibacter paludis]|nr:hypothetical protein [Mucilaginibacter paludis]